MALASVSPPEKNAVNSALSVSALGVEFLLGWTGWGRTKDTPQGRAEFFRLHDKKKHRLTKNPVSHLLM